MAGKHPSRRTIKETYENETQNTKDVSSTVGESSGTIVVAQPLNTQDPQVLSKQQRDTDAVIAQAATAVARELTKLPRQRLLELRTDNVKITSDPMAARGEVVKRHYNEASIAYIVGTEAPTMCEKCARGSGRMEKCVTATDLDGNNFFRGACANCRWRNHPNHCSFHEEYKPAGVKSEEGNTQGESSGVQKRRLHRKKTSAKGKEKEREVNEEGAGDDDEEEERVSSDIQNRRRHRNNNKGKGKGKEREASEEETADNDEEDEEEVEQREPTAEEEAEELQELEREKNDKYRAGPDKNYGYRWLNWWYPETGGAPFWTGVPEDLRKERQEQQEHLIDLEERMIQRRGVRADAKYGPNDYIKDYILDYVDEKGNRISPKE